MSGLLKLRRYQEESIAALHTGWAAGMLRLAVVLPTGMGKTVIFAHLAVQAHAAGRRALVLVHRDELVNQAVDKLHQVAPHLAIGVVKAERNELGGDVIVASVQTLSRSRRLSQVHGIGLVIVDEAHHAAADSYLKVLRYLGCFTSTPAAGFTATMSRNDHRGLGDVWSDVVYRKDILYGIRHGHLADVRGKAVTVDGLNLSEVARSRGDYQEGSLGAALTESGAGEVIARAYVEHAADRQGIVFAPTVATAHSFADDLAAAGIPTAVVTGSTPTEERALIYKRYRAGEIQVLSNCMVLTEGFDMPEASAAVIARLTSSPSLYVQMVGRVLRPFPGKTDALVLDVVGVAERHGLASLVDLSETRITPRPGESLTEAAERLAKPAAKRGTADGQLLSADVEMFRTSTSAWLRTYGGTWFIPTRDATYFLWPDEGGYKVGRAPKAGKAELLHEGLNLTYAMSWAEQDAEEEDASIAQRSASWRRKKEAPTDKQLEIARRCRLPHTGLTKVELSDLISVHLASIRLDAPKTSRPA